MHIRGDVFHKNQVTVSLQNPEGGLSACEIVLHRTFCLAGKRGVLKRPWSEAERVAVETHLKRNLMELRVPAKADCERCLELCPLLVSNHRDWRAIKFYVHNRIQLLKKQGRRESAAAVC